VRQFSLALLLLLIPAAARGQGPDRSVAAPDGVSRVLRQIERAMETGDAGTYAALAQPGTADNDSNSAFVSSWVTPGITRAVVRERLRVPAAGAREGDAYDVYVDVLAEYGRAGRVATWLLDVTRDPATPDTWRIAKLTVLTTLSGLDRLELNPNKEFTVDNLTLTAEDFQVRLPQGIAFIAETRDGTTAAVLIGRGDFTFSPAPRAEKGQVKIFCGSEILQSRFDSLYVRVNPDEFYNHVAASALVPRPVDRRDLRRADLIFQDNVSLSYGLDLADLSRETWSVAPKNGELVTELLTDRAHLTYMRSASDPEDIRFFDRTHQRTVALYPSKDKLATRGPFFSEDDQVAYDILNYDVDASFDPAREWMDGKVRVMLVAKKEPLSTLILNLAAPLVIRSVVSQRFGYLMALRVSGQTDVIINLPEALPPNTILDLEFVYGGRLPAVPPEREALDLPQGESDFFSMPQEPSYIYTGRSYWYPEGPVSDYATANLHLRVPDGFGSVASGALDEGFPKLVSAQSRNWKQYQYSVTQPVRYLAWAVSRFEHVSSTVITLPPEPSSPDSPTGVSYSQADVSVEASGMFKRRATDLASVTQDVLKFYGTVMNDLPYQSFSLAVVERTTPGGHSPPYFAALSQPPPAAPISWRTDPAYFSMFPEFFVAHEAAHQWWGQAVGWKNYHEQWLSEGMAQYFAALYAEHLQRGDAFEKVIGQLTRSTVTRSSQGPVYLGYRLGHIKNDSRVFRALVYNKGALVLHMLRRLIGDDVFFKALKRYYITWRFKKAGTEDLKAAFEAESHQSLGRFFDRWIYNDTLPHMKFSYRTDADALVVRFEQVGEIFDVPVTVSIEYAGQARADVMVPVDAQVVEHRFALRGPLKSVEANRDDAAPVIFVK
jgi:hypothetical protein